MCSRYEQKATKKKISKRFGPEDLPDLLPNEEVRPTDKTLVIRQTGETALLSWGLHASWDGKPLINARAETLKQRKTFRPLLENRCLVPATAYFEWRKTGRSRLKNRIASVDGEPFAFAGLYSEDSFTIITCAPSPAIAHIHNRMPVILAKHLEAPWLDPSQSFNAVAPYLTPYPDDALEAEEHIPAGTQTDLFDSL